MSKSVSDSSSGCNNCCSSKSLYNVNDISTVETQNKTIQQFITDINSRTSDLLTGIPTVGPASSTLSNLNVNDSLSVSSLLSANAISTNSISFPIGTTVSSALLSIVGNVFYSSSVFSFVSQGMGTLTVGNEYTGICSDNLYIYDDVPVLGTCSEGGVPAVNNNDLGFETRYGSSFGQFKGFFGFDRTMSRPGTQDGLLRFVAWQDALINGGSSGTDQNYYRNPGSSIINGIDAESLHTYLITNVDDPNLPASLNGYNKTDINVQSGGNIIINAVNQVLVQSWIFNTNDLIPANSLTGSLGDASNVVLNIYTKFLNIYVNGFFHQIQSSATSNYSWTTPNGNPGATANNVNGISLMDIDKNGIIGYVTPDVNEILVSDGSSNITWVNQYSLMGLDTNATSVPFYFNNVVVPNFYSGVVVNNANTPSCLTTVNPGTSASGSADKFFGTDQSGNMTWEYQCDVGYIDTNQVNPGTINFNFNYNDKRSGVVVRVESPTDESLCLWSVQPNLSGGINQNNQVLITDVNGNINWTAQSNIVLDTFRSSFFKNQGVALNIPANSLLPLPFDGTDAVTNSTPGLVLEKNSAGTDYTYWWIQGNGGLSGSPLFKLEALITVKTAVVGAKAELVLVSDPGDGSQLTPVVSGILMNPNESASPPSIFMLKRFIRLNYYATEPAMYYALCLKSDTAGVYNVGAVNQFSVSDISYEFFIKQIGN